MKKKMIACCLLFVGFCLSGCAATIQSSPQVKIASEIGFDSLPRTVVITLPAIEKKEKKWEQWDELYRMTVSYDWSKEGQEILCQAFQKELGPGFKVLKELPTTEDYLLVNTELGKIEVNLLSAVATFGQYSSSMRTRLTVSRMPGNQEFISREISTIRRVLGSGLLNYRGLFRDALSKSGAGVANILKSKPERKGNLK